MLRMAIAWVALRSVLGMQPASNGCGAKRPRYAACGDGLHCEASSVSAFLAWLALLSVFGMQPAGNGCIIDKHLPRAGSGASN